MKLLLLLLIPSISFANDLNFPLFTECSNKKIIQILPVELKSRIKNVTKAVDSIAKQFDVNPCIVLSMVWTESTFKSSQRSFKGANGLMQVMTRTANAMHIELDYKLKRIVTANLSHGLDFWEVENLIIGTAYYSKLLKKYKGNRKKALIAYNMGMTYVANNSINNNHNYLKKVTTKFNLIAISN
jgi:soluble lytic murein transglycosylase-like protein